MFRHFILCSYDTLNACALLNNALTLDASYCNAVVQSDITRSGCQTVYK